MVNAIDAQLGLVDFQKPDQQNMQMLADQLRRKKEYGNFLSLSPTVGDYGQNMASQATQEASTVGTQRTGALNRARQAETDKLNAQKEKRTQDKYLSGLKDYTDIRQMKDSDGKTSLYGFRNGKFGKVEGSEGLMESSTTGKQWKAITLSTGEEGMMNYATGQIRLPSGLYNSIDEAERETSLGRMTDTETAMTDASEWAKADVKEVQARIDDVVEMDSVYTDSMSGFDDMIQAIDDGANAGRIYDLLPTFTNATARLETAKSKRTLDQLAKYKLTPVSDKDLAELRKAATPNLTAPELKKWAIHKKEGVKRMQQANRVMENWLRDNRGIPTGEERGQLQNQIDRILHDGYDFVYESEDVPTEEVQPLKAGVVEGVTTLSDGSKWDAQGNQIQ